MSLAAPTAVEPRAHDAAPRPRAPAAPAGSRWRYPEEDGAARDLRIDFMRGLVMTVLIVVHIEIFSLYDFLVWERVGIISGAEGFVILSGIVLGMVHRRRLQRDGWRASAVRLLERAMQLYRVNVAVTGSVLLLTLVPSLDTTVVTTFTDRGAGTVYPLYPGHGAPWWELLASVLWLRATPHQFQIMGLYIVLLVVAPLVVWAFEQRRVFAVLAASWVLYVGAWAYPAILLDAQFEYAFPPLTWQLLFVHGLAFGYHRDAVMRWCAGPRGALIATLAIAVFLAGLVLAQQNPNGAMPAWSRLSWMDPAVFNRMYSDYFQKKLLGPGRLVNYAAALTVAYLLLTRYWRLFDRALGWFLVPIGQASLYVFVIHVYIVLLIANLPWFRGLTPSYGSGNLWLNTAAHASALMLVWTMVTRKVGFSWIPR